MTTKEQKFYTNLLQAAIVLSVVALFAYTVIDFLQPIIMGVLMALVFRPLHQKISSFVKWHSLAAALTTLIMIMTFVIPFTFVILTGIDEAISVIKGLNFQTSDLTNWTRHIPRRMESMIPRLQELATALAAKFGTWTGTFLTSLPKKAIQLAIYALTFFYACFDWASISRFLKSLPFDPKEITRFAKVTENICRGVVIASLATAGAQALIMLTGFLIFSAPQAFFFGLLVFFASFIPVIGSAPVGLGMAIYFYSQQEIGSLVGILIFTGVASVIDNIIRPIILNERASLHPLLALISALGGISLFGIPGIVFGPLLAALMVVVLEMFFTEQKS